MKILKLTFDEFKNRLYEKYGKGKYHAAAAYREIFLNGKTNFENINEFSNSPYLAQKLKKNIELNLWPISDQITEHGVTKIITKLENNLQIESVVIPMFNHKTLCVSSQVGCKMGCSFCETAKLGFIRNLSTEEIVGQVYTAKTIMRHDIRNIVFMGMGEPFDNFDNVIQAIKVIEDQRGLNIAKSRITISTAGKVDGILKLAKLNWKRINIAVSLNASNEVIRSRLMPINRKTSMQNLRRALMAYPLSKKNVFFIEYVLIKGVNDSPEHAKELAQFLKPLKTRVNLISYNPGSDSAFEAPDAQGLENFRCRLVASNLFVRVRSAKGQNLMAACGQLGNSTLDQKISLHAGCC